MSKNQFTIVRDAVLEFNAGMWPQGLSFALANGLTKAAKVYEQNSLAAPRPGEATGDLHRPVKTVDPEAYPVAAASSVAGLINALRKGTISETMAAADNMVRAFDDGRLVDGAQLASVTKERDELRGLLADSITVRDEFAATHGKLIVEKAILTTDMKALRSQLDAERKDCDEYRKNHAATDGEWCRFTPKVDYRCNLCKAHDARRAEEKEKQCETPTSAAIAEQRPTTTDSGSSKTGVSSINARPAPVSGASPPPADGCPECGHDAGRCSPFSDRCKYVGYRCQCTHPYHRTRKVTPCETTTVAPAADATPAASSPSATNTTDSPSCASPVSVGGPDASPSAPAKGTEEPWGITTIRESARMHVWATPHLCKQDCHAVVDYIDSLHARVRELEEALRPFAL